MNCTRCRSYAINHHLHGRDGSDGDLCDVCYWRKRAESSGWHKADEQMPEANKPVLVLYLSALWKNPTMAVAINFDGTGIFRCLQGGSEISRVTHWMPLPEPPEKQ